MLTTGRSYDRAVERQVVVQVSFNIAFACRLLHLLQEVVERFGVTFKNPSRSLRRGILDNRTNLVSIPYFGIGESSHPNALVRFKVHHSNHRKLPQSLPHRGGPMLGGGAA